MDKKSLRFPALVLFGIYAVYGAVLIPFYQIISADLVLMDTLWWDLVDFACQLFEILGIGAAIGFLVQGIYRHTYKKCVPLYLLLGGALLFKYVASIVAVSVVMGYLDLTADFISLLVSFLIEAAELVLTAWLGHKLITTLCEKNRIRQNAARALDQAFISEGEFLPFRRLFSRVNALQRTVFWSMIAVLLLRLASHIIGEIAYGLMGFGFSITDIPVLLLSWLILVIIPCFLAYLLALGCILLAEKKKTAQKEAQV